MGTPLSLYQGIVETGWVDANGHMMDGYYAVAFGEASWVVQDYLGMDASYRDATQSTLYTVEAHLLYLRELKAGERFVVESQILGVDRKRLRLFHRMKAEDGAFDAATMELMLLHFNQATQRTVAFPESILDQLQAVTAAHQTVAWPPEAGRQVKDLRPSSG
jgi:acyl-CoA thioesterase FadM